MRKNTIRSSWPKIRIISVKGEKFYQLDARRQGTNGKRETFSSRKGAEKRAAEIEAEFLKTGTDALLVDGELRAMALRGQAELKPYQKTLADAVAHYKAFLDDLAAKSKSKTISELADEWYENKANSSNRRLKHLTLEGIRKHAEWLKGEFGNMRLLEFTEQTLQDHLDLLEHSQRRKFNIRSLTNQFFNWCIRRKYIKENPVAAIEISVPRSSIHISPVETAVKFLEQCEKSHNDLTLYVAISLFAGLRPTECELLKWENIHLEERQITVLSETSKVSETRNVPIEDNLLLWLNAYKGERADFVTTQKNLRKRIQKLRIAMGYKLSSHNLDAEEWKEDAFRHSYASYWLAKYKDQPHLAENMGNSLQVIKRHYKAIVTNSAQEAYWNIKPGFPENVLVIS
jgi:integrase